MAARSEPKLALTRDRILSEAVAFADEHGLDGLSMRKLAERLGVAAMSLYTHVANRDELIAAMVDRVVEEIELPDAEDEWRRSLRSSAASAHAILLDHPWVAPEWTRRMPGPARLRYMDAILATLDAAGLDRLLVYRGYHAITMHIVGFSIQEDGYRSSTGGAPVADLADRFLEGFESAGLTHLAAHVRAHLEPDAHPDEFVWILDLLLDGLERANGGR